MTALRTRRPTGVIPWPLILVEGQEKSGKSWACAELSASERVGQTYWIDLGEGSADEYGAIPGADYLIVEHDGSFGSILAAVAAVRDEAAKVPAGEPPVVLVIDSMTAEWDLLKGAADKEARAKLARKGRRLDPGDEPQISMDLWNKANGRHRKLMTLLMTFPGIVVMTARGKEVAALDAGGRPIEGRKEYKVEGHKNLAYDASAWVRVSRERPPLLIGARSVSSGIRPGVDQAKKLPDFTLEHLIFVEVGCSPATAKPRDLVAVEGKSSDLDEPSPAPVLLGAIDTAETVEQLLAVWERVKAADGRVTADEADEIREAWKTRHAALTPATEGAAA